VGVTPGTVLTVLIRVAYLYAAVSLVLGAGGGFYVLAAVLVVTLGRSMASCWTLLTSLEDATRTQGNRRPHLIRRRGASVSICAARSLELSGLRAAERNFKEAPMRFLPTKIHGALDYLVGIALLLTPNIFQFSNVGGPAVWIPRLLGVVLIVYSIFTNYEWGVIKVLPMSYHLMVDFGASLFLAASPFLFGFINQSVNAWLPHIAVGVTVILVVLVTQTHPGYATTGRYGDQPA
jgi:hypothetical protein